MAERTQLEIKQKNRKDIFNYIYYNPGVTKQQIMQSLELSLPTVLQNIQEMDETGYVCKSASYGNTGGRRAAGFSVSEAAKYAIGVDINLTHLSAVAVDLTGNIVCTRHYHVPFERSDAYFSRVSSMIEEIVEEKNIPYEKVLGVGIGLQGIVSPDGEIIEYSPMLNLTKCQSSVITKYIKYPCILFHDADMAALGETFKSPHIYNSVYVSLSTNLGGSVIIDNKIYWGDNYFAGKIEHMTLFPGGDSCYCGKEGCAEAYCSCARLLSDSKQGDLPSFFDNLSKGDTDCVEAWDRYVKNLSILLNNLHMLFDCNIILGGYMAEYITPYIEEIQKECYSLDSFKAARNYIVPAQRFVEPVAYGSAIYYILAFISEF